MQFDTVVGLEIHVQLKTKTKVFCGDSNNYGDTPNHNISAISLAHPGTLPRLNEEVVKKAILFSHAIGAKVNQECYFDRKHYFYPDLPKGYQLTQDRMPICSGGSLVITTADGPKKIRFHHTHLEEDAGKLIHKKKMDYSYADLNRAGVPLIEIVTEPDFRSGAEVFDFLKKIQQLIRYIGISDANMEEGSMRCDCNVSVMPSGSLEYGTRAEVKNINSKKFAQIAIKYEASRQIQLVKSGGTVVQETRHFNSENGTTYSSRDKEDSHDYRYLPDPDIPAVQVSDELLEQLRKALPKLPNEVKAELIEKYGLSVYQADLLSSDPTYFHCFESYLQSKANFKVLANFIINQLIPYAVERKIELTSYPIKASKLDQLLTFIIQGNITSSTAMQNLVPKLIINPSENIKALAINQKIWVEGQDSTQTNQIIDDLIIKFPEEVKKYKSGKKALIGFFIGQAMKNATKGIDPNLLKQALIKRLSK